MTDAFVHRSVMLNEVLAALRPQAGGFYADATAGSGGHSEAILAASSPDGQVLAVDRDPRAVEHVKQRLAPFGARARVVHGAYADLPAILEDEGRVRVDGLVADLGVSSPQLDDAIRGFSFAAEGPLDMRMDTTQGVPLSEFLADIDERELADILFRFGDERRSRPIARSILRARDEGALATTLDLRRAVLRASGPRTSRIDPATRSFQALRVAVNGELEQLQMLLGFVPDVLDDGAVVAMISFHSLEDRMVKHSFRGEGRLLPLTKRPVSPSPEEEQENPRSRSAKLRAARRLPRNEEMGR